MLKNKCLVYVLVLFMGFCLLFSPHLVFNVMGAVPITLADWDDVASGLDDGTSGYFDFDSTGTDNYFETSVNYDLSPANSFMVRCYEKAGGGTEYYGKGYWNLTDSFSYISNINFTFVPDSVAGLDGVIHMYIRNATGENQFYFKWDNNAKDFFYYEIGIGAVTIDASWDSDTRYYLNLEHNGTNQFIVTLWQVGTGLIYQGDHATYDSIAWTTFDHIYLSSSGLSEDDFRVYFDDIIIDTTYTGDPGDLPAGYLGVNCFNETSGSNITEFNVLVVNQDGDIWYDYLVNNTYVISGILLPQGEDVMVTVSKTGYYPRTYTIDVFNGYFYYDGVNYSSLTINAYLPDISLSALYYIQVIDEYLYPVEDAHVIIKGWVGSSNYTNVSDTLTDGYGFTNAYLCWGSNYQVTISKSGYNSKTESWIPDASKYGIEYPKVFKINSSGTDINETYDPWDIISFTGTMYTNGTIKVVFDDILVSTTNATFYTFELYNFTSTLKSTNVTTNDSFTFWVHGLNASRTHRVELYLNHTILGYKIMTILLSPVNYTGVNATDIEDKIHDVFGDFKLGYVNFFLVFLPAIVILVLPGTGHPGLGVVGAGLWMGFSSVFFGYATITVFFAPFLIALGIILMIVKGGNKL